MEANAAYEIRFRQHEARLDANHNSVSKLRDTSARHDTEIKVTTTEVREIRDDLKDMREQASKDREERRAEGAATRKALYTISAFIATFSVSIMGLIAVLLGPG